MRNHVESGPFVIERKRGYWPATFLTKTGGWTNDREKAWKFDTRRQAEFSLRGRHGDVVPFGESDGSDGSDRSDGGRELVPVAGKMRTAERALLQSYEQKVQVGLESAKEARAALREIRDKRLYRERFATFEEYMEKRWGYSARQGHRLVDWAVIEVNLLGDEGARQTGGDQLVTLPASESQARPLKRLKPAEQREAWQEAVASAPAGQVTAKHVEAAVQKRLPARPSDDTVSLSGSEFLKFDKGKAQAVIALRKLGQQWVAGSGYSYRTGNMVSTSVALKHDTVFESRAEALVSEAATVMDIHGRIQRDRSSCISKEQVRLAGLVVDWARSLFERAEGETRRAKSQAPMANGKVPEFAKTPKEHSPVQVKDHERKRMDHYDPLHDAKDRATDAAVELNASLDHIQHARQQGRDMETLVYEAEEAKRHLRVLRALIDRHLSNPEAKR